MAAVLNTGVILAAVYGLLGLGYVVVYRSSGVLNFAYGGVMTLGGYVGFTLASHGLNALVGFGFVVAIGFAAGWLFYRVVLHRLAGQPPWVPVLVTVGVGFFIVPALIQLVWSARIRSSEYDLGFGLANTVHQFPHGIFFTTIELIMMGAFVVFLVALLAFYRYSRIGIWMRAAAHDHHLAAYRAINIDAMFGLAWGIATALGMFIGFAYAVNTQLDLANAVLALKAFAVAMVGGLDSIAGVAFGALIIGLSESAVQFYVDPLLAEVAPFLALLAVLLFRPWGLFGTPELVDRV